MRRRARFDGAQRDLALYIEALINEAPQEEEIEDDRLRLIDGLLSREELATYHLAHAACADLCRRLGRFPEARASYEKALALARQEPERRFLAGRLRELT